MHKISVNKQIFLDNVSFAGKVLPTKILNESFAHIAFTVEDQKLTIKSTNSDFRVKCIIDIENTEKKNFQFTLNSKILEKLLQKVEADVIDLYYNEKNNSIKIYTTEDNKSFVTLKSLSKEDTITFDDIIPEENVDEYVENILDSSSLLTALKYVQSFLPEDNIQSSLFNIIAITDGFVYGTNGINKIGFILMDSLKDIKNYQIKKNALPIYLNLLELTNKEKVSLIETNLRYIIKTSDERLFFSTFKYNKKDIKIPTKYLSLKHPYVVIHKSRILKAIDRLNALSIYGSSNLELVVLNDKDDTYLKISLVEYMGLSNDDINSVEYIKCERTSNIENTVKGAIDYKTLKTILSSIDSDTINLYLNQKDMYLKIFADSNDQTNYTTIGIGAFLKISKNIETNDISNNTESN